MSILEVLLERDILTESYSLGRLYVAGMHFGFTCEDTDRELETGGVKIPGTTAIPRGRYRLTTSLSNRFGRELPLLENVPGFSGVRVHGGNTAADTEGCLLLGRVRTGNGVANCAERVGALIKLINDTDDAGNECWIIVR